MDGEGNREQNSGDPKAAVEDGDDGRENCSGRERARVKVLIGEVDGDARQGQSEQGGDGDDRGPMRLRLREAAATDSPATVEHEEDGGELPEQDGPSQRQMSEADRPGDEFVEDGGLELQAEEFRVVRRTELGSDCA